MKTITKSCIRLDAHAASKDEAIRLAGQLLADAGYIDPGYIDSLLQREQVANTFLGGGVAIPHGMIEHRHLIHHTGVAILQFRDGTEWNEGQKAHLVVAIAAQSDEHTALLRRLIRLMQQPEALDVLFHADNPLVLIAALGDAAEPTPTLEPQAAPACPADAEVTWIMDYPNGLHARPATRWVETAKRFPCELRIYKDAEFADAKGLTDLLVLGVTCGTTLRLAARGPDAQRALNALHDTVRGLSAVEQADAERARRNAIAARKIAPEWTPSGAPRTVYGLGASPGLAVGKLVRHVSQRFEITDQPGDVVAEGEALEQALLAVRAEREELEGRTRQRLSAAEAAIFAAQHGPLWIMFPMVTHISEIEALRGHCELAREQVGGPEVKLGIMVEVPAVAVLADRFAPLVDFFSIGTNDLTQYTLAVDRQHPELAAQADSLNPAVLNLIDATVRGAQVAGRSVGGGWVGVCGGLAGDLLDARILTGLGVDELSMSAQDIAPVKAALCGESRTAMQELARRALRARTAEEVRAL